MPFRISINFESVDETDDKHIYVYQDWILDFLSEIEYERYRYDHTDLLINIINKYLPTNFYVENIVAFETIDKDYIPMKGQQVVKIPMINNYLLDHTIL